MQLIRSNSNKLMGKTPVANRVCRNIMWLIKLLTSKDPDTRFGAARTLGDIGNQRAITELVKVLDDPDASVRYWAVDALGKLHADEAVEAIRKLLKDKQPSIKQQVGLYPPLQSACFTITL